MGDWEGKSYTELQQMVGDQVAHFWHNPIKFTPPGAEPLPDFARRVRKAWNEIKTRQQGNHTLVVAHGGTIRVILADSLGIPLENIFRIKVPYACLTRCQVTTDHQGNVITQLLSHSDPTQK